jgi:hypothetical protein
MVVGHEEVGVQLNCVFKLLQSLFVFPAIEINAPQDCIVHAGKRIKLQRLFHFNDGLI